MVGKLSIEDVREITTEEHFKAQTETEVRRYKSYAFTQGLKSFFKYAQPDNVQELVANREFGIQSEPISLVQDSPVSNLVRGLNTKGRLFDISFDRSDQGNFPWREVKDLLGRPSTLEDVPVRRVVLRFQDEELLDTWKSSIEKAIDQQDVPTYWIEGPFFAVLESKKPGISDARDGVRREHPDEYYTPDDKHSNTESGFPWDIRTLDLEAIWSFRSYVEDDEAILTSWDTGEDWTPRKIELAIMNHFAPDSKYSGIIRNQEFLGSWRNNFSSEATSYKVFEWEEDQEWVQLDPNE